MSQVRYSHVGLLRAVLTDGLLLRGQHRAGFGGSLQDPSVLIWVRQQSNFVGFDGGVVVLLLLIDHDSIIVALLASQATLTLYMRVRIGMSLTASFVQELDVVFGIIKVILSYLTCSVRLLKWIVSRRVHI